MWIVLQCILTLLVHLIIIVPVFALVKELFPVPKIDAFFAYVLPFFHIPVNQNTILLTEVASLIFLVCFLWSFILPYFPITAWLQRFFAGQHKPNTEEQKKINETLLYMKEKTNADPEKYKYYVVRTYETNAFASGKNDITITSTMIRTFSVDEMAGIIAHEMGHHKNKDVIFMDIANGIILLSGIFQRILNFSIRILNLGRFIPIFGIIAVGFAIFFALFLNVFAFLIYLPTRIIDLFFNRQIEYKADSYAVKIGLGKELAKGLFKFGDFFGDSPWWKIPILDHPRLQSRIRSIHKQTYKDKPSKKLPFENICRELEIDI